MLTLETPIESSRPRPGAAAVALVVGALVCLVPRAAVADRLQWPQPDGPGTPVSITYSFSNLFDAGFAPSISEVALRAATAEALTLWSRYAPLHFFERPDSGPPVRDEEYPADGHPQIRIGHRPSLDPAVLAYAYLPADTVHSGLAGDIHFNGLAEPWGLGDGVPVLDFLEVMAHEIGHALGLWHIPSADAIMGPFHGFRFQGLGTAFLLPADIAAIRSVYGSGVGSVHAIPEPSTLLLLVAGAAIVAVSRRRRHPSAAIAS